MNETSNRPERLLVMDLGRGFAVICMILIHTLWMHADVATQTQSTLGTVIHFIGKGTAAFLIFMGLSFVISRNQTFAGIVKRGFIILMAGYFMNFLKFIVPIAIFGTMPEEFIAAYGWKSPLTSAQYLYLLKTGDILQIAGIALIIMAFIRHFVQQKWLVLGLALSIAFLSREVSGLRPGIEGLDYIFDLFFSDKFNVYFPVFPWMSCILIGMFFGMWYKETNYDQELLIKRMLIGGLLLVGTGGGLMMYNYDYHFNNFFHLGPGGALYLSGINLVLYFLIHHSVKFVRADNAVFRFLTYCSKRVTSMYVIQWTLVCWAMGFLGFQAHGTGTVILLMPCFIVASLSVQWLLDKLIQTIWHRKVSAPATEAAA
ncbi:heparan-alpha-glucosaminide N-acetyltransferase domain-containing protein [Pleionea sp. CnH1-48]|uniref:heparan-alpha-glucosaminide N-acetyltransferase domain-containing protein n=1 Tax=Pleionea sp. CnH1-48 TaxID=2954494 RepID=UPI002097B5F0|nr:heparan-alpha-glucosaminide N-acetyltransferase domain-containing protein [Pleionea sp. CnH1-48]MCO7224560.1 DUF1624 domain-containing protein [Pleionea sp. CnH1-48]